MRKQEQGRQKSDISALKPKPGIGRTIIKLIDRLLDKIAFFICLILFLLGLYGLYDSYMVYQSTMDNSLLKFKPGYEGPEAPEKEIQGNMVAWLTIDDTQIDYPIMQGDDNTEYLNKDPYGDYSLSGSIFLDSRNNAKFKDEYSLVYGHHMEHNMMFGALDEFLEESYFNEHRTGTLTVGKTVYQLRVFAVLECEATEPAIFAPTEAEPEETLDFIKQNALFLDDSALPKDKEKLLGLSTCKYPDTVERTMIFAAMTEND